MRTFNQKLHLWLGLGLALFLGFQGLTGAFLIWGDDIDRVFNAAIDQPAYLDAVPRFDAARQAASALAQDSKVIFIDAPRASRNSYRVVLDNALGDRLYLHPQTLELLLRRGAFAEPADLVEALHTGALGGEWLEILLGVVGLLALPLLVTGVIRWWPGWRRLRASLCIRWGNLRLFLATGHRAAGAISSVLLLLMVATGTLLGLHEWTQAAASGITGQPARLQRPQLDTTNAEVALSIDVLAQQASRRAGGATPSFVILPRKPGDPVVFRLKQPQEWHPSGRSEVYFDPRNGTLVDAYVLHERNGTQRFLDGLYPIHIAAPLGRAGQVLWSLAGLCLLFFSVSGVMIWWYRR